MDCDYNKLPRRKNIRLKQYDYSAGGYYFITICTKDMKNLFWNVGATCGEINVGATEINVGATEINVGATCGRPSENPLLSNIGITVDREINNINSIYDNVEVSKYIIMPNHVHMIIILHDENGRSTTAPTIGRIIKQFKGSISKQIGFSLWQKSFYDHIIKNQQEYLKIWNYIDENPLKWAEDKYYMK